MCSNIFRENDSPPQSPKEPPVKDTPANLIRTEITCRQDNHVLRHNIHVRYICIYTNHILMKAILIVSIGVYILDYYCRRFNIYNIVVKQYILLCCKIIYIS